MQIVPETAFGVVELRRYTTHPGRRDALIDLFERELIETQEACGMVPFGHFRDLDDPDAFVWLRGFARMETRRDALQRFYTSPAWHRHRAAANATMADSDDVLLLRNARSTSGFDLAGLVRPAAGNGNGTPSVVAVSVVMLGEPAGDAFVAAFEETMLPELRVQARRVAHLVTEDRANDFPALPVREGEHAFVVSGSCPSAEALTAWCTLFERERLAPPLQAQAIAVRTMRLVPAPRSLFR